MIKSDTTSGHIKVCSNAYHEAQTLYNGCKDNLLLFSNSDKKSLDIEGEQLTFKNANDSHNSTLYLSNISNDDIKLIEAIHPNIMHMPIGEAIELCHKKDHDYRHIEPKVLNRQISRIKSYFDPDKPISHGVITKLYDRKHPGISKHEANRIGIDGPDQYRKDALKVLLMAGEHEKVYGGVVYGLEQGANGLWHFHFMVYGFMKPHKFILNRTGWGYIKIPDDRKEYFDIHEDSPNRITGFHPTAKYCLEKHHPHKKAFVIFGSKL